MPGILLKFISYFFVLCCLHLKSPRKITKRLICCVESSYNLTSRMSGGTEYTTNSFKEHFSRLNENISEHPRKHCIGAFLLKTLKHNIHFPETIQFVSTYMRPVDRFSVRGRVQRLLCSRSQAQTLRLFISELLL